MLDHSRYDLSYTCKKSLISYTVVRGFLVSIFPSASITTTSSS